MTRRVEMGRAIHITLTPGQRHEVIMADDRLEPGQRQSPSWATPAATPVASVTPSATRAPRELPKRRERSPSLGYSAKLENHSGHGRGHVEDERKIEKSVRRLMPERQP